MAWTTTDLLAAVRRKCRIPDSDAVMSSSDILALADEETRLTVEPAVRRVMQDYGNTSSTITLVNGTRRYRLPSSCFAGTVRSVWWTDGVEEYEVDRVDLEDTLSGRAGAYSRKHAFAFEGDYIRLAHTPGTSPGSLVVRYARRPSRLIAVADAEQIGAVNQNPILFLTAVTALAEDDLVDITSASPGFALLADSAVLTADTNGAIGQIAFTSAVADVAVGDYVTTPGETCVPQIPDIAHDALIAATSCRVLEALRDTQAQQVAEAKLGQALDAMLGLIKERDEGDSRKVVARTSPLRSGWGWR